MMLNGQGEICGSGRVAGFNHDAPEPPLELSSLLMFQRLE